MLSRTVEINPRALEKVFLAVIFTDKSASLSREKEELVSLALSANCRICGCLEIFLRSINPALFLGKGKVEELAIEAKRSQAEALIFNVNLSPGQQSNIEQITGLKTIDRTLLILDIFSRHAFSREGKIQVELARLEYLLPRLKGKGIMLSRLGGGIGTRGPGEKKIEVERRRIFDRISRLRKDIQWIKNRREILRARRKKSGAPLISLVGYTSSGKTTLLNSLTSAGQKTSKYLFTTLDPLGRIWQLDFNQQVILFDTVGFIHNLPSKLLETFKSTLEEISQSEAFLHVVDVSRDDFEALISISRSIVAEELKVSLDKEILVFNKIDRANPEMLDYAKAKYPRAVLVSALFNRGLDKLAEKVKHYVSDSREVEVVFNIGRQDVLNFLYKHSRIINISSDSKYRVKSFLQEKWLSKLKKMQNVSIKYDSFTNKK